MATSPKPLLLAALCLALTASACKTREITSQEQAQRADASAAPQLERQRIFIDDFNRAELGPSWKRGEGERGQGQWRIEDGWLAADHIKNDPLWLIDTALPHDVRVEFDAKSLTSVGDLKAEIFGDGVAHSSGYVVIFGGWKNSLDVIARLDEHGEDRKAQPTRGVQPNHVHKIAIERVANTLSFEVDGEVVMRYDDPKPLTGAGHERFAFNNWTAPVRFKNLSIYALVPKAP